MTALVRELCERIELEGPLTIASFMTTCLLHPRHGYYTTQTPFGAAGDFVTAPEISQMFGELIGLCLAQAWLDRGAPKPFNLVELGPGQGTLMADILRATAKIPGFGTAARIHMVEASPTLRDKQISTIENGIVHHDTVQDLPFGPTFLVANEFFDALPIRQFVRQGGSWRERVIGVKDGELAFGLTDPISPPELSHRLEDTSDGDLVEISPTSANVAQEIGQRLATDPGAALIIDYGDWRSLGDTFQAVKGHQKSAPLACPGEADLSAHVDFEAIALAAHPAVASRLTPQGVFLERLGITERARNLAARLAGKALETHVAAHRRLTHPDEMGTLFKVMALYSQHSEPPPGVSV